MPNVIGALMNVAFPETQDYVAARRHVSVLGGIELNPFGLPGIRLGELVGASMPILTIELNHGTDGRDKGINAELATDKVLGQVLNSQIVKEVIARLFEFVGTELLLLDVHLNESSAMIGVGITTLERAVSDVIGAITRRRPVERLAAYLASVSDLVSCLPFIQAFKATKARFIGAARGHVVRLTAPATHLILTVLARGPLATSVALKRTIDLTGARPLCHGLTATCAGKRSDLVLVHHTQIVSQFGKQSNQWSLYATP